MNTVDSAIPRDLEDLIDAAAAEMTQAVPSPGFSARVLANLDRRSGVPWSRIAAGITAVAAAALFALWLPRFSNSRQPDSPGVRTGPVESANQQTIAERVSRQVVTASRPRRVSHAAEISADEAAWLSRSVSPLSVAPAIWIDAIHPERATIAPISVQPLVPEPIDVTPLVSVSSSTGGR